MSEINKTYEELEELKGEVDKAIVNLKKEAKSTVSGLLMRTLVVVCTASLVDKAVAAFLPKQLKGPIKAIVVFGSALIPEIMGAKAEGLAAKIMEEE